MNAKKTNNADPQGKPGRRWLWPVLIVSLALNLLVVGVLAGNLWSHRGGKSSRHHIVSGAIERLMKDIPAAKREQAGALLARFREEAKSQRQPVKHAIRDVRASILAEPYNEAKVSAGLARLRELRTDRYESIHSMLLELMKGLTLEERQKLLDHIRAGFRRGKGRWRNDAKTGDERR